MEIIFKKSKEESNFGYEYEFIKTNVLPEIQNITSVVSLVKHNNKIFLTKNHRGWELPGGHVEEGEELEEALIREIQEEVGTNINNITFWGHKKIIHKELIHNRNGGYYPFPFGYILFYISESTGDIFPHHGKETIDSGLFSIEEAMELVEVDDVREILLELLKI